MKSAILILGMVSSIAMAQMGSRSAPKDPAAPDAGRAEKPMGAIKIENPEAATIQNPKADRAQKPTTKKPSAADVKAPTVVNPKIESTNENPQVSHPKDSKELGLPKFDKATVDQANRPKGPKIDVNQTCEGIGRQIKAGEPGFEQCKADEKSPKNK